MINVTLKCIHFRFIASLLQDQRSGETFRILSAIKSEVKPEDDNDQERTISCKPEEIIMTYPLLSSLPEGLVADINRTMDQMLIPQVISGVKAENEEWIKVKDFIENYKERYAQNLSARIAQGTDFLNQIIS